MSTASNANASALNQKNALDSSQQAFCFSPEKNVRLLAPAGSGKTHSLLWRCLNLWTKEDKKSRFLLLTFTKAARDEIKDRLNQLPDFRAMSNSIEVTTLNAWGYRRIKAAAHNPKLCSTETERYFCLQNLLQTVWKKHPSVANAIEDNKRAPKAIMNLIDNFKELGFVHTEHKNLAAYQAYIDALNGQKLQHYIQAVEDNLYDLEIISDRKSETIFKNFFKFWIDATAHMIDSSVFTMNDQKYFAYLDTVEKIKAGVSLTGITRYNHIIVDEFQDINPLDMKLLKSIADLHRASLTIVGDDDQAIFEWRGATPEYILDPEKFFDRKFEKLILSNNYRCPPNILEMSQKLISNNRRRVSKKVTAISTAKAKVSISKNASFADTIDFVVETVEGFVEGHKNLPGKLAIIGRKRAQLIPYQVIFASKGIPFCAAEDLQIFLSETFENLKHLLMIRYRTRDARMSGEIVEDVLKMCNWVKRYPLSKKDKEQLAQHLKTGRPKTYMTAVDLIASYNGSLKGTNEGGKMSQSFADSLRSFFATKTVTDTLHVLSQDFDGLEKDYGKAQEDIFFADPPFLYLAEYATRYGDDFATFIEDIERAIDTLAVVPPIDDTITDSADKPWKRPVHLMTALRAKGKEFDTVVVLDVNDGIWPIKKAESEQQKEQERRLFYVAITRAKESLIMTVNQRIGVQSALVSPYIAEMGL